MKMNNGQGILRIVLGFLFLVPGIMKLMNPSGITGLLGDLGFPAASFFAWILLLSEIIFGLSLIIGWKTKITVWPLIIILVIATLKVAIPSALLNPMGWVNVLFHLLGIASLISIYLDGPGAWSINR